MKMKQTLTNTPLVFATLAAAACMALSGCASPKIDARVKADSQEAIDSSRPAVNSGGIGKNAGQMVAGGAADADRRAAEQASQVVLRRASRPWVASVSVPMGSGEKLPSVFQEPVKLNFSDTRSGGKVSLRVVAERITAATGVPVRVKPDVFASAAGPAGMAPGSAPMPPLPGMQGGGAPGAQGGPMPPQFATGGSMAPAGARDPALDAVSMRWNGSLEGYLNHVTDLTNLSWEYRDGVIVIERFRTEFFEIATLEGETSYSMGLNASDQGSTGGGSSSGGGGGGSGSANSSSNASVDVSEKGRSNVINTILGAIGQIIKDVPGSSAIRSDGSGRIAVTTTKETMTKVRDFVRAENESLLRQAQVQFDIYSVRSSESNARGVAWDALLRSLSDGVAFNLKSPPTTLADKSGSIGFSVLEPGSRSDRFGNSKAILQLLNQYGTATQHRPISLLTLNRQWARKASLGSKGYVSETTPATATFGGTTGGQPGLKTATITTGDRYLAQPYIMDNNTVVLKFGIGLSSLVNLVDFQSGGQTVQTPETTNIVDQSTVALKTGQVLVITGMSRFVTSESTNTLTENSPVGAGGNKTVSREREDFIIFVRPSIL